MRDHLDIALAFLLPILFLLACEIINNPCG